ncbi:uncharacterized protein LOC133745252 isoform X4 [Rosa rugosa]|uniref:uncharacterized protein LOC133745252 isoform X4 n=1 Tax=Rosa rugosa TaxID=74645 RepID=UPI002B408391|nr:uncharacterized protein LOC133745252 isoform X4 [Rosa rugosa]
MYVFRKLASPILSQYWKTQLRQIFLILLVSPLKDSRYYLIDYLTMSFPVSIPARIKSNSGSYPARNSIVLTEGKQKDVLKAAGALFSHICEV